MPGGLQTLCWIKQGLLHLNDLWLPNLVFHLLQWHRRVPILSLLPYNFHVRECFSDRNPSLCKSVLIHDSSFLWKTHLAEARLIPPTTTQHSWRLVAVPWGHVSRKRITQLLISAPKVTTSLLFFFLFCFALFTSFFPQQVDKRANASWQGGMVWQKTQKTLKCLSNTRALQLRRWTRNRIIMQLQCATD